MGRLASRGRNVQSDHKEIMNFDVRLGLGLGLYNGLLKKTLYSDFFS